MDLEDRCTRCAFGPRPMVQPRFVVGGVHVCAACATFCVPEGLAEPVGAVPLEPFACGIAALAATGLCEDLFADAAASPDAAPVPAACEAALARAVAAQGGGDGPADHPVFSQLARAAATRRAHEDAALLADVRRLLPVAATAMSKACSLFPSQPVWLALIRWGLSPQQL